MKQTGLRTTNRAYLAGHFQDRLLALAPASVLDVGCGSGTLVDACRAAGVRAVGIEPQREAWRVAPPSTRVQADATALPFRDASFDWVTFRHVPHHLPRPDVAFADAWRVARLGLLVAEPWFDPSLPSQQAAAAADRWLKRQERKRGRHHADVLSSHALTKLVPSEAVDVAVETHLALRAHPLSEFQDDARDALAGATPTPEEAREWAELLERARAGALTLNGTLIVEIRRRS